MHGVTVKEGYLGLYKGNFAQMIRIFPYAAVQFLSYEQYKKVSIYRKTPANKYLLSVKTQISM